MTYPAPPRPRHSRPPALRPRNPCTDPPTTRTPRPPDTCIPSPRNHLHNAPFCHPAHTPLPHTTTLPRAHNKSTGEEAAGGRSPGQRHGGPRRYGYTTPFPTPAPRSKAKPCAGSSFICTARETSRPLASTTRPPQSTTCACAHPLYIRVVRVVRSLLTLPPPSPLPYSRRRSRSGSLPSFSSGRARPLLLTRVCQTSRTFWRGRR